MGTDGRYGRQHGRRKNKNQTDKLLYDAHSTGIIHASSIGNYGNGKKAQLDETILHSYREAYLQNTFYRLTVRTEIMSVNIKYLTMTPDSKEGYHHTEHLRQGSTQCRTSGSPPQISDKEKVEKNIHHTSHSYEINRTLRIAQPTKD